VGVVVIVIFVSIFLWAWAVRRPAPVASPAVGQIDATPTEEPPITYAAIGASDVVGVGANDPNAESWVNRLHSFMPPGTRFLRFARSGIVLREANTVEVPQAVQARPDIVTIWNAVNDALGGVQLPSYIEDLDTALSRLTRETDAHVVLLNLPDITILMNGIPAEQRMLIQGGVRQWNKAMAGTAAKYGDRVTMVDLFPISDEVLDHPEYISGDNFHPSSAGYKRLAEVVWEVIREKRLLERR
jgi:lysophospholipase L1-like esterase